mmetsp:Transcript_45200/g.130937  ORF Transcript_45200/g.130937 Transcript_45200/m.130937 type:complete len:607 (+) Transcript_45200:53-1873(+)
MAQGSVQEESAPEQSGPVRGESAVLELDNEVWRTTADAKVKQHLYSRSCYEFLLLGPLFTVFVLLLHSHMSLSSVYSIERVLKFAFLSKRFGNGSYTIYDVHSGALFWEWFETVLEETVAIQEDQLGHTLPQDEWGYINGFNKIIGGVRLVQKRGDRRPCEDDPARTCYGLDVDKEPFGYPPCGAGSEPCYDPNMYRGIVDVDANEGFTVDDATGYFEMWLDTKEPRHILKRQVRYLEDRHWIDKQTRLVTIELLMQNYQFEPLLSIVLFRFRFDQAGYIEDEAKIETVPAHPYWSSLVLKISLSACYVVLNLFFLVHLFQAWKVVYSKKGSVYVACKRILFAKGVEITNVLVAIAQISLWSTYVSSVQRVSQTVDGLQRPGAVPLHNSTDAHLWHEYHHEIAHIEHAAESCIWLMKAIRLLSAIIMACFLLRYFQVWEGIPAFAVVTKTLSISAHRIGAVATSTAILLILFAGSAMLTYGAQLEEFHSIEYALQETAVIAMTGDPGAYSRMLAVDPVFAACWYWSLIAIVFMVVLNMVLGVLVDAASAAGTDTPITLSQQFRLTLQASREYVQSLTSAWRGGATSKSSREKESECRALAADTEHV